MCEAIVEEAVGGGVKVEEGVEGAGWWIVKCQSSQFTILSRRGGWDRGDRGESEMSDRGRGGYR